LQIVTSGNESDDGASNFKLVTVSNYRYWLIMESICQQSRAVEVSAMQANMKRLQNWYLSV
jgi:hypothetical protein